MITNTVDEKIADIPQEADQMPEEADKMPAEEERVREEEDEEEVPHQANSTPPEDITEGAQVPEEPGKTVESMIIPSAATAPLLIEPFPSDPLPLKPAVRDVQVVGSDCATPTWLVPPKFTSSLNTFMTCEKNVVFEIPALIPPEVLRVLAEQKTVLPLRDGNSTRVSFSNKKIKIGSRHTIKMDSYENGTYECITSPDVSKKNMGVVTRNRRRLEERRRR